MMLRLKTGRFQMAKMDFNVWDYSMPELYGILLGMFVKLDLVDCLGLTPSELLDFIIDVDHGYMATFYHSFYHAADVTAVLYHILLDMNASQYLSKPDMAALLLAGLCHDIGHPGLNNLFQVNAKTELCKEHGETSVLEKYSCSLAMDLVNKHQLFRNVAKSPSAILPEGNSATEASMKEAMVKAIMATDMSFHYDMLNNLNTLIEFISTPSSTPASSDSSDCSDSSDGETDNEENKALATKWIPEAVAVAVAATPTPSITTSTSPTHEAMRARFGNPGSRQHVRQASSSSSSSSMSGSSVTSAETPHSLDGSIRSNSLELTPELRQNLFNCLLHAADISNAVKPWALCKRWSDLVVQEFFRQGDIEKAQALPVSPSMDRVQHNQPQISIGFSDFVVQPYFESFVEFLPQASPFLASLAINRVQWLNLQKAIMDEERAVPVETEAAPMETTLDTQPKTDPHQVASPLPAHLTSGRRVSVAAGVLVLDDTRPQRAPHRRLRHSTNTEASHNHSIRKIKRSHSGRSLSSCLHHLHHQHTAPRSLQAIGKSILGQEAIVSVLKREVAQVGKETAITSAAISPLTLQNAQLDGNNRPGHGPDQEDSTTEQLLPPPPQDNVSSASCSSLYPESQPGSEGKPFRHQRLGSLQLESIHPSIRQDYGDGYLMPDEPIRDSNRRWDQRLSSDIPMVGTNTTSTPKILPLTANIPPLPGQLWMETPTSLQMDHGPLPEHERHPASRSSTPAVMQSNDGHSLFAPMGQRVERAGLGPLDLSLMGPSTMAGPLESVEHMASGPTMASEEGASKLEPTLPTTSSSSSVAVSLADSFEDGPVSCVVGTSILAEEPTAVETKLKGSPVAMEGVVCLSAATATTSSAFSSPSLTFSS